jgi:predicted DNA-binding transcriptional regulator YafY
MARRTPSIPSMTTRDSVTRDRAGRLCRLVRLLGAGSQTRAALTQKLRLDVRGFYRDLSTLRKAGVVVELRRGRYVLQGDPQASLERLPFPDPHLTLGEAVQLGKGRTAAHRKVKALLDDVIG